MSAYKTLQESAPQEGGTVYQKAWLYFLGPSVQLGQVTVSKRSDDLATSKHGDDITTSKRSDNITTQMTSSGDIELSKDDYRCGIK